MIQKKLVLDRLQYPIPGICAILTLIYLSPFVGAWLNYLAFSLCIYRLAKYDVRTFSIDYCCLISVAAVFVLPSGISFVVVLCLIAEVWFVIRDGLAINSALALLVLLVCYLLLRMQFAVSDFLLCVSQFIIIYLMLSFLDAQTIVLDVFHAAALKQVPSCEFYPMEAVKTNIQGSDNVISACVENHVQKAIFLSTDKAAYPINAMGMTKAVMEKDVIARSRQMLPGDPILCLTRYGNVMGSRGSVIPLFCEQIDEGKQLTITNPEMTRFMMTLNDAVDLVLYAFEHGQQGDLFVQKAPAATIETLAQAILELKHANVDVTTIGTRHGEKLYEVLVTSEEMLRAEDLPGFFRIHADNRDLNYDNYFSKGTKGLEAMKQYTSHNTQRLDVAGMKQLLLKLKLFGGRY